jgi:hypothetical protein
MIKKTLILPFFLIFTLSSFAQQVANGIFVEGAAVKPGFWEYFLVNFKEEAKGTGYLTVEDKKEAEYIFRFDVTENTADDDFAYVITIRLLKNEDDYEILKFDYYFNDINEMYELNQSLFLKAVSVIPREGVTIIADNRQWQNKWLYLRVSFDYPLTFYLLQGNGLIGGSGVYYGDFEEPIRVSPVDNEVYAMPGATVGVELQFFHHAIFELSYSFFWGAPRETNFVNMASNASLKFPIKFSGLVLAPYGTFSFALNAASAFSDFPIFSYGGGMQFGVRGGKRGSFFIDVKYLYSHLDAIMKNPYGELFPSPEGIYFKRSVLGLGVGYKIGFFDRKTPQRNVRLQSNIQTSHRAAN